jgi:hypothetical protein
VDLISMYWAWSKNHCSVVSRLAALSNVRLAIDHLTCGEQLIQRVGGRNVPALYEPRALEGSGFCDDSRAAEDLSTPKASAAFLLIFQSIPPKTSLEKMP